MAGDAPESNSSENEFPLIASLLFLPDFVYGYLGMPGAEGVSESPSARLMGT